MIEGKLVGFLFPFVVPFVLHVIKVLSVRVFAGLHGLELINYLQVHDVSLFLAVSIVFNHRIPEFDLNLVLIFVLIHRLFVIVSRLRVVEVLLNSGHIHIPIDHQQLVDSCLHLEQRVALLHNLRV